MPVYEFYCPDCHAIFNFFSRRVDTTTQPGCPQCARTELERQVSPFAIGGHHADTGEADADGLPPGVDEAKLMNAFASMSGELERLDEDDPQQAARAMRRLFESSGLRLGEQMAEALGRMEAGEDPDQIDAELGTALDDGDPFAAPPVRGGAERLRALRREFLPPARDETWYPLAGS